MAGKDVWRPRQIPRWSGRTMRAPLVLLGLMASVSVCDSGSGWQANVFARDHDNQTSPAWSWSDVGSLLQPWGSMVADMPGQIRLQSTLQWSKCYGDAFECARLEVPMDWQDPSSSERVTLGVVKLPAKSKENPLPPVFVNPGGPGGSGVYYVKTLGRMIQTIVGDNQDVISWDPRGVGVSTPRVECWGSATKRQTWDLQDPGVVDARPGLVYDTFARAAAFSGVCEAALNGTKLLRHLNTAYHARDMLAILEQTGHSKLRYWGISYGTALGGAFAGLFPDRVERLVSDGNVDYAEYFGVGLRNFLRDADAIMDAFDEACHTAGRDKCALWAPSAKAIERRRAKLLASLKKRPVLIPARPGQSGPDMPQLVTYSRLQQLTRLIAYAPSYGFQLMAQCYAALEAGDGPGFYDALLATAVEGQAVIAANTVCPAGEVTAATPRETLNEPDAFAAIICADSTGTRSLDEFVDFVKYVSERSRWLGAANSDFGSACAHRAADSKWRFGMDDIKADTAFPILYVGNTADNVTPLESAYNNSVLFPSSSVLVQNSLGHTSMAAPSTCSALHIRTYFQNGTLPAKGTRCEQDIGLFDDIGFKPSPADSPLERKLRAAVYDLWRESAVQLLRGF